MAVQVTSTNASQGPRQRGSVGVATGDETEVVRAGQTEAELHRLSVEAVRFGFRKLCAGQIKHIFRPDSVHGPAVCSPQSGHNLSLCFRPEQ